MACSLESHLVKARVKSTLKGFLLKIVILITVGIVALALAFWLIGEEPIGNLKQYQVDRNDYCPNSGHLIWYSPLCNPSLVWTEFHPSLYSIFGRDLRTRMPFGMGFKKLSRVLETLTMLNLSSK